MRKNEKNAILQRAALWSDEKLEHEYYKSVFDCLGSQAEVMEERGYDARDVRERRKIEDEQCEYSDVLESICEARGINLWRKDKSDVQKMEGV